MHEEVNVVMNSSLPNLRKDEVVRRLKLEDDVPVEAVSTIDLIGESAASLEERTRRE